MWHPALPPAKPAPATHRGATCARLLGRGGTAPCRCPAGRAPRPPLPPTRGRPARGRPSAAACCRWKCPSLECAATPGEAAAAAAAAPAAVSAAGAQRPLAAARAVAVERSSARPGGRCRQRHRWCWRAGVAGQGGRSAVGPGRRGVGVAAAGWVPAGVRGAHRPALVAGSVVLVVGCWRGQAPSGPWENSYEGPRPLFRSAGTGTHQQRQNAAENSKEEAGPWTHSPQLGRAGRPALEPPDLGARSDDVCASHACASCVIALHAGARAAAEFQMQFTQVAWEAMPGPSWKPAYVTCSQHELCLYMTNRPGPCPAHDCQFLGGHTKTA